MCPTFLKDFTEQPIKTPTKNKMYKNLIKNQRVLLLLFFIVFLIFFRAHVPSE